MLKVTIRAQQNNDGRHGLWVRSKNIKLIEDELLTDTFYN